MLNVMLTCTVLGDQTPTPTKFLKSCDELGLFQEFTRNPFDEEFRKSAESSSAVVVVRDSTCVFGLSNGLRFVPQY